LPNGTWNNALFARKNPSNNSGNWTGELFFSLKEKSYSHIIKNPRQK
jgi:hypothetical protein